MKLRLPLLLAAVVMACYSHVSLSADTANGFSINFYSIGGATLSGDDLVGMEGVETAAKYWNNISPTEANKAYGVTLNNLGQEMSGITVTSTRAVNDWHPGRTTTQTDKLLSSYIDASAGNSYSVSIAGVPYLSSTLYLIMSGDGGKFTAMNVNGTNWTYKDGAMAEGTEAWGNRSANQGTLTLGINVLQVDDIIGGNISISNVLSSGRGTIAGIQVVDTYEGTYLYRTLDSTGGAWSDALWSETDGTAGTLAWGGAGNGAVLKADAGGSTLTLSGTVVSDGVILQSGKLILSGGTLNMTGPAAFVTGQASTIKFDGTTVTSSGTLVLSGSGTYEISDLSYLPLSVDVTGGTLNVSGDTTVRNESNIWIGNTATFDAQSVTVSSGGSVSVANGGTLTTGSLSIEQGGSVFLYQSPLDTLNVTSLSGNGELVLATAMGFNKDTLPEVHTLLDNFGGALTLKGAGESVFDYSSMNVPLEQILTLGMDGMVLHIAKGASLNMRLPDDKAASRLIGTTINLSEGGTLSHGVVNGNKFNATYTNGITIVETQGVTDDSATIKVPGYMRGIATSKLNGSGTLTIQRLNGYNNDPGLFSQSTFAIDGVDDNETNRFTGEIVVNSPNDGTKYTYLSLNHQLAAQKAKISLQGTFSGLFLGADNVIVTGLESPQATARIEVLPNLTNETPYTLTVKGIANYAGKIGGNLSLDLAGGVEHVLSGDLSAFTGTITVADNTASNLTLSGSSSADGVNLSMSQGNLTTGVKVNLLSADSSSLTLSLTAGGQIVVTGTASAFASTTVTGAGMIGMDLNSSAGTLDLGNFSIGTTGDFLRIDLSNTDDLSQFSLTATGTSLDVLRGSLTVSAGNKLYTASGYTGNNVSFSEIDLLVNESESGADKYYYRNGGSVTLSQSEYSMNSLLINGDADEATTDEIILNGAALSANSLTFTSSDAYAINDGETAGSLEAGQLSLLGAGTLTLNTASTIGSITGSGSLVVSKNTIIQSGTTTLASLNFNGTTLTLGNGNDEKAEIIAEKGFNQTANTNLVLKNGSSLTLENLNLRGNETSFTLGDDSGSTGVLNTIRFLGGDGSSTNTTMNIKPGNVFNITGTSDGTSGTGALIVGHWGRPSVINLSGVMNVLSAHFSGVTATKDQAKLNVNEGGILNIKGLYLAYKRDSGAGVSVILNEGGTINIGGDGIKTDNDANFTLNLNGGTLGILNTVDSWTGGKAMTIGGSVTLNTDKYTPDTTAQGSDYDGYLGGVGTITISGGLTGTAGTANLTIAGGGEVVLSGANGNYQGGITIESGATLTATGLNNRTLGGDNAVVTLKDGSKLVFGGETMNDNFAFNGNIVGNGLGTIESSTTLKLVDTDIDVETVNVLSGTLTWQNTTNDHASMPLDTVFRLGERAVVKSASYKQYIRYFYYLKFTRNISLFIIKISSSY